jgi:hypothetical protein
MPSAGFEFAIPAGERPQTYALDRAAIWIGYKKYILKDNDITKDTCRKCREKLETLQNVTVARCHQVKANTLIVTVT